MINEMVITGSLTEDFYKFIEAKIDDGQTGEEGSYLLGEGDELKIAAERVQTGNTAGALEIVKVVLEILKDTGVEMLAGLLVEYIRDRIKSKKETHEGLVKKLVVITKGNFKQIEMTNYSPDEIKMLKSIFNTK